MCKAALQAFGDANENEGFREQFMKPTLVLHRPQFPKCGVLDIIVDDPGGRASKA
jgi:hypothetical protein